MSQPLIIQGGMGVAVSNWRLARSVAQLGQLGVISGTLLAVVFARRLQAGDPEGHMADAMVHFPLPTIAERVRANYFVAGGKPAGAPFKAVAMPGVNLSQSLNELTVLANFAEIHLAKQGHSNPVGINLLEKIQVATLASLYGAMLAGVDYVLMARASRGKFPECLIASQPARPPRSVSMSSGPPPAPRPSHASIPPYFSTALLPSCAVPSSWP
jgi:NAD(P)H-dependent flavin oxidoreductase YrpB (nitropropane dioxygenase family)